MADPDRGRPARVQDHEMLSIHVHAEYLDTVAEMDRPQCGTANRVPILAGSTIFKHRRQQQLLNILGPITADTWQVSADFLNNNAGDGFVPPVRYLQGTAVRIWERDDLPNLVRIPTYRP